MNHLTAIDLFSGCGGLTSGLKKAGFKVLAGVESEALEAETYRINHPEVKLWQIDIRQLDASEVACNLGLPPEGLDLVAGCPPCQGFSSMRTLNGRHKITEPRNDLIFDFLRFVQHLRPKAVLMENVPGLEYDSRFTILCEELESLGYRTQSRILNTVDFEVPQKRRRLVLLAGKKRSIPFAVPIDQRQTVRDTISDLPLPGASGDPLHDLAERRSSRVMEIIRSIPPDGGSREDLPPHLRLECHKRFDGFKDVYGRMKWDAPSPTITGGCVNPSKGRFLHPDQDRAITLREAALLQTFPADYQVSLRKGKYRAALMIGNALPPNFVYHQANEIARQLEQDGVPG